MIVHIGRRSAAAALLGLASLGSLADSARGAGEGRPSGEPWARHVIDDRFFGSDGTRLADVDGDGRVDVLASWENAGLTRISLQPERAKVRDRWPSFTIAITPKAEEALWADLDGDGTLDVISSQEQHAERVVVFWGPGDRKRLQDPLAWRGESFPAVDGVSQWMFAEAGAIDGRNGPDLVIGGKNYERNQTAWLGWLEAPARPRDVAAWAWHPLANVSWVMSIKLVDLNGDGHRDVLYTDKQGPGVGAWWLEHPGTADPSALTRPWKVHRLIPDSYKLSGTMFLALGDVDRDGLEDIVTTVDFPRTSPEQPDHERRAILFLRRLDGSGLNWATHRIAVPPGTAQPKGVAIGDLDGDGRNELVLTSTGAEGELIGTYYLKWRQSPTESRWEAHNIAGAPGIKYDVVHLIDLDGDGDPDVLTNDEKEGGGGLGVVWYENPVRH